MKEKKKREKYVEVRTERIRNIDKILEIIGETKKSYSKIKSNVLFSDTTLSKHLAYLQEKHFIEKKIGMDNKFYYVLTKKGRKTINLNDIMFFQQYLENIRNNDGRVFYDYSELGIALGICSLPWGIDSHLIINRKLEKLELLKSEDIEEIEKLLYKKIMKNVKNTIQHSTKFGADALELLEKGKFVLGFNIDLDKVHKSIKENSLEKFEKMTKEEIDSLYEADNAIEEVDDSVLDKGAFNKKIKK